MAKRSDAPQEALIKMSAGFADWFIKMNFGVSAAELLQNIDKKVLMAIADWESHVYAEGIY